MRCIFEKSHYTASLAVLLLIAAISALADVTVTILDVGNADAIVIESEGHVLLVDTGRMGATGMILDAIRGYNSVDAVVLTHPHADHIGGFIGVLGEKRMAYVLATYATNPGVGVYDRVALEIASYEIPILYPNVGDSFPFGDAVFTVYAPHPVLYNNLNDTSLVLRMEAYGKSMLFMGDAEIPSEYDMLANQEQCPLQSDVIKLAHHGKDTSSSFDFLCAVQPTLAIASAGDVISEDVHMNLIDAGCYDVRVTNRNGNIVVTFSESGIGCL